jgi:hypothetical protein
LNVKKTINKGIGGSTLVPFDNRNCISNNVVDVCNGSGMYSIISVMGGTNDYGLNTPLGTITDTTNDTVYGALNVIAKTLKRKYPNAFIFFMEGAYRFIYNITVGFHKQTDRSADLLIADLFLRVI